MKVKHLTPILNVSNIVESFAWFPDGHTFRVSAGIEEEE